MGSGQQTWDIEISMIALYNHCNSSYSRIKANDSSLSPISQERKGQGPPTIIFPLFPLSSFQLPSHDLSFHSFTLISSAPSSPIHKEKKKILTRFGIALEAEHNLWRAVVACRNVLSHEPRITVIKLHIPAREAKITNFKIAVCVHEKIG